MKNLWNNIKREHVIRAIQKFEKLNQCYPKARNTFLLYKGKRYPAKYIRGLAFKIANNKEIDTNKYSGGQETVNFFRKLGFEVEYIKKTPIRIVTVCVEGESINDDSENREREEILKNVMEKIKEKWKSVDVIVFPGGYFYLNEYIGHKKFPDRKKVLEKKSFSKACVKACKSFRGKTLLIVGVDSEKPNEKEKEIRGQWEDQLAVAWSKKGIEGVGRKIFPVRPQKNKYYKKEKDESLHYLCYEDDFSTKKRIVKLRNGEKIILCSCYDMFGVAEPDKKMNSILFIKDSKGILHKHKKDENKFKEIRKSCIEKLNKMIKKERVVSGIAAIHHFASHGNNSGKVMWQRHGIASCSAKLGKFAVGATHFEKLPEYESSTLVSNKVPKSHLTNGHERKSHEVSPKDHFTLNNVLVRLFEL